MKNDYDKMYELKKLPAPNLAIVPLFMEKEKHIKPLVKLNQIVKKGQCIGKNSDECGVDIFSPIYGKVVGFDLYAVSNREKAYCVFIENMNQNNIVLQDKMLQAKLDAMKNTMTKGKENRFDFNIDSSEDDPSKIAVLEERKNALNTMFSSPNAVVDFQLEDAKKTFENTSECETNEEKKEKKCEKETNFQPFDNNENLLDFIKKCGVLTQNGESLAEVLKNEKTIVMPCFDDKNYCFENMAVLVNHFDELFQTLEVMAKKLEKQIILLHRKGDKLPDLDKVWEKGAGKGIFKLCVCSTNANKILKKHFEIVDNEKILQNYGALNKHFTVLSPTSIYFLWKALKKGEPQTSQILTIGGASIENGGVYEVCSGCTLEHIKNSLGGTMSEQDIEDDKMDAMEAVSAYYEFLEEYKHFDEEKKLQEKQQLQEKKDLADKLTKKYVKTAKKNLKKCLAQIVFDDKVHGETHGNFQAVCELKNNAIFFLSVKETEKF